MGDPGLRHVSKQGHDANDGLTWETAYATIQCAVLDLKTTWPNRGGVVQIGAGTWPVNNLEIAAPHLQITLRGLGAGTTVLEPAEDADYGLKFTNNRHCVVEHLAIGNPVSRARALWIESSDAISVRDVWFMSHGLNWQGCSDIESAPCCLYMTGSTEFSDWHMLDRLDMQNCYRGIVVASNAVFSASQLKSRGGRREGLYVRRKDAGADGPGGTFQVSASWFAHSALESGYVIHLETDASAPNPDSQGVIVGCITETQGNHVFCGHGEVKIIGHSFVGGPLPSHAVYFTGVSRRNKVIACSRTGTGGNLPAFVDDGTDNEVAH